YLYSNSNYNLLAMIAERVSGKTLAEFTKVEFFEPLGMTSSGWRDDYKRVVPGRAQAYSGRGKDWRLDMPFENVYGNSSLLTTVGDLLKWDANFGHKKVGGAEFVTMQTTRGLLKSGREISYAVGMVMGSFQGTPEISHTGATASYRAFLARYPDAGYAVALLCNAGSVDPGVLGRAVSTVVLPVYKAPVTAARDTIGMSFPAARLAPMTGYYRNSLSDEPLHLAYGNGRIVNADGPRLVGMSDRHFTSVSGRTHFELDAVRTGRGRIRTWADGSDTTYYVPVDAPRPATSFGEYAGSFYSAEADAAASILVENGKVVLFERPSDKIPLSPVYADGFDADGSYVKFVRDSEGQVNGFLVTSGRARNVRFDRVERGR
ncbi:MAG: serine hydrolase domain-containing protein, partial [Gemmatimonadaceae bacterium]